MELIAPEKLPVYVPGTVLADSAGLGWDGVALRTYAYHGQDVEIPPMRDYMLVSYQQGVTPMQRTFGGKWTRTTCGPGAVSLLTRSQTSHWFWTRDVEVTHVYLTERLVFDVVSEVSGRSAASVDLADVLRTEDGVMTAAVDAIAREASEHGMGSELYVDAVARQLVIHLLRRYADIGYRTLPQRGQLSEMQKRTVLDYIESRLHEPLSLKDIAAQINMAACTFSRYFRRTLGTTPYAYVMDRRLERASHLLRDGRVPTKQIAGQCGFFDQAHLTRQFSRRYRTTPTAYRISFLDP